MYKNFHASLFIAMSNVVDNLMLCYSRSCRTCNLIHDVIEHPVVKEMLERPRVSVTFIEEEPTDNIFIDFYWETSRGDSGKGFRKFSLDDLGFVANNCVTHFAKIGELNGTHRKYIKNEAFLKDEEDGFKACIMFISRQTNENFVEVLQDKLIEKLEIMGEEKAVTWIKGCAFC